VINQAVDFEAYLGTAHNEADAPDWDGLMGRRRLEEAAMARAKEASVAAEEAAAEARGDGLRRFPGPHGPAALWPRPRLTKGEL